MKILVINGPNLNMLGIRAPEIYGTQTYADLVAFLLGVGEAEGIEIEVFQSNSEGEIITKIQEAYGKAEELLNRSIYALGTDLLREEVNRKKKEGASKEELGDTKVELTVLGDSTNVRVHCYAKKDNRIPQTNEITTKYGTCRFTRESRRLGVTSEDIAAIDKEFKELLNS